MTTDRPTLWQILTCGPLTAADRRNMWVATGWVLAWQVVFVLAAEAIERWEPSVRLLWAVIAVPTVVGLGAIEIYRRFVMGADELQRRIQLHSMAVGFGFAIIGSELFELLAQGTMTELPHVATMVVAVAAYVVSVLVLTRHYS